MSAGLAGIGEAGLAGIGKASEAIAGNRGIKGNKFDAPFGNIDTEIGKFSDFILAKMGQVAGNRQGPKGD